MSQVNKIDVHVMLPLFDMTETHRGWLSQCVESIPDNTNVIFAQGIQDALLTARINAFSQGTGDWLSFVDWDDLVTSNDAFVQLLDFHNSKQNVSMVFSNSNVIDEQGIVKSRVFSDAHKWTFQTARERYVHAHQLVLLKRSVFDQAVKILNTIEAERFQGAADQGLFLTLGYLAPIEFYNKTLYSWRHHSNNTFRTLKDKGHTDKCALLLELDNYFKVTKQ